MAILAIPWNYLSAPFAERVCMAPFHVRSKVCIASFKVKSKFAVFAPQIEGSNADLALHMEGSHANFAPHMEHKHSFRDQKLPFMPFSKYFFQTFYILEVYMTYLTIFEKKNSLRDSPLTTFLNDYMQPALVIFATLNSISSWIWTNWWNPRAIQCTKLCLSLLFDVIKLYCAWINWMLCEY